MTGGYEVQLEHGGWKLHLGLHAAQNASEGLIHTRVLARFKGREDVRLLVRRRAALDRLAARLGFKGLGAGGRQLLDRYFVKGRPATRVRSVISGGLADAILETDAHRLQVGPESWFARRTRGPYARTLQVLEPGAATDPDRLVGMVVLAQEALDALQRAGLATPGLR